MSSNIAAVKRHLRTLARQRRIAVVNPDALSRMILHRALALDVYQHARTVMFYVDAASEVRTRLVLPEVLASDKAIVVPWCDQGELRLFRLMAIDDLAPGSYNLLEPHAELRERPDRQVSANALDVVFAPGIAFDRQGRRLGQGRGYYDRLFPRLRPDAVRIGLAFETQLFPEIPAEAHDVPMHYVITEAAVYAT